MNKDELNKEIAKLKLALESHTEQVKDLQNELDTANKNLADIDKPKLTPSQFSDLHNAIENAIDGFNFNEPEAYQAEFGIDYDGKVYADSIEFDGASSLVDDIIQKVEKMFGVADESDDEDASTEVN